MSKRKLTLGVSSIEDSAKEFIDIWRQIEAGTLPKNTPIEKISFSDERLLFKILTAKRRHILHYVHDHGKISIRTLAKELHREYAEVMQDVKALTDIGLLIKDKKTSKYFMPWDKIVTEIPMRTPKHQDSHYKHNTSSHRHASHR